MIHMFLKDLKLFIRDVKAFILVMILPIALVSLFTLAYGGMGSSSGNSRPMQVAVSDLDSTATSINTLKKLDSIKGLKLKPMPVENAKKQVKQGNETAVLVLYQGFADSIEKGADPPLELFFDRSQEMEVNILQQAITGNLMGILGSRNMEKKVHKMIDKQYADLDRETRQMIHQQVSEGFSQNNEGFDTSSESSLKMTALVGEEKTNWGMLQAVAGVAVMMLLFSVAGMAGSILAEREEGTLKRLLYAPIHPNSILFGKMLHAIVIAIIQLIILFVFSWLVFGLDIFSNFAGLFIMIITTAIACTSFGIFLAAISQTRKQAESLSTIVILIMSAIGGSMIPTFIMPTFMQNISVISVNYWSIQGFFDILGRNLPIRQILPEAGMLLLIAGILIAFSIFRFRKHVLKVV